MNTTEDNEEEKIAESTPAVPEQAANTDAADVATEELDATAPEEGKDAGVKVDVGTEENEVAGETVKSATAIPEQAAATTTEDANATTKKLSVSPKQDEDATEDNEGVKLPESAAVTTEEVATALGQDKDVDAKVDVTMDTTEEGKKAESTDLQEPANTDDDDHGDASEMKAAGVSAQTDTDAVPDGTKTDYEGENISESSGVNEKNAGDANSIEDFSHLTVVQLKDRLRALNLHVSGRKQELIDRLNSHLYPNLQEAGDESKAAASKSSRKRKTSASVGSKKKSSGTAGAATPSSNISSIQKSRWDQQYDTPSSVLSHPDSADSKDDESM